MIKFKITNFSDNNSNDFSPTKYKNGILFVSDRNPDNLYYDLYFTDFKSKPKKVKINNNKYHIGQVFYDDKEDVVYLTKSSKQISENNRVNLAIYKGKIKNNKIRNLKKLNFCNPKFSYGYAQVKNNTMLIHTDEGEGYSLILYELLNKKWIKKEVIFNNENPIINPVYINENTIVFASKYLDGLGGFDLYQITKNNGIWSQPFNLTKINTKFDELSLLFINKNKGYISSNRKNNKDNIFEFTLKKQLK